MELFNSDDPVAALYIKTLPRVYLRRGGILFTLIFEQTACLFDYLPADACTYVLSDLDLTLEQFWLDATGRYESRRAIACVL